MPEMKAAEHDVMKSRIGTPASIIASVVALMAALSAPSGIDPKSITDDNDDDDERSCQSCIKHP